MKFREMCEFKESSPHTHTPLDTVLRTMPSEKWSTLHPNLNLVKHAWNMHYSMINTFTNYLG